MPPLNPQETEAPNGLTEQIQSSIAPLQNSIAENARAIAQLMQVLQNMQGAMQTQDAQAKQILSAVNAQAAAASRISMDIQVASAAIMMKVEQSGRLG